MQPESIVITFSDAMDPASAQNVNNYRSERPARRCGGVRLGLVRSRATHTVTLKPKKHVNFHVYYTLTINGVTSAAVTSTSGLTLDGMKTGDPGNSYVGRLRFYWLHPYTPTSATKTGTAPRKTTILKGHGVAHEDGEPSAEQASDEGRVAKVSTSMADIARLPPRPSRGRRTRPPRGRSGAVHSGSSPCAT